METQPAATTTATNTMKALLATTIVSQSVAGGDATDATCKETLTIVKTTSVEYGYNPVVTFLLGLVIGVLVAMMVMMCSSRKMAKAVETQTQAEVLVPEESDEATSEEEPEMVQPEVVPTPPPPPPLYVSGKGERMHSRRNCPGIGAATTRVRKLTTCRVCMPG